ncbi:basement membrane-specific heparan sulfate proteoglycan core protein isoform X7 [Balearica regulorum gibbericeps]|uniref:basement membrane-specific heparan sulfate proteoglycan core protein isoform X7 n=1 Tax=Balearica regulorum gibbericeps TaxID=100784 RepID=UPI003F5E25CB
MGLRDPAALGALLLLGALLGVTRGTRGLAETSFPEDTVADDVGGTRGRRYYAQLSDDEDLVASGDGSGEDGSGVTWSPTAATHVPAVGLAPTAPGRPPAPAGMVVAEPEDDPPLIYFRALVNFTRSIDYSPRLEDPESEEFREVSEAVVDTLESEYYKVPGEQVVSVVFIKELDGDVFVELDVGSEGNGDEAQLGGVLRDLLAAGSIASYLTSPHGFQFRRLGAVTPHPRACTPLEFTCGSGECVAGEYRCDRRPDCRDASDEDGCDPPTRMPPTTARPATTRPLSTVTAAATPPPRRPLTPRPPKPPAGGCQAGEAACADGRCVPRDYLCDGEPDCTDGSDEEACGTPSPCEPNEFKCRNGHCALKLWRCDGENDCGDGSDETDCPTKAPGAACGPAEFRCVASGSCIRASYQCDREPDCPDRSDEVGCVPPQVVTLPRESVRAVPGQTVTFTCVATGVPTPIITWRLNWGHTPSSHRVSIVSEAGQGTLTIRDVKEADQGAYTCEAINTLGMVFGIPDSILTVTRPGPCPEGHFQVTGTSRCLPCFCFGVTTACRATAWHRHRLRLRFDRPDDFKGVNVTVPAAPSSPALSATQLHVDVGTEEFQLLDLSRRFLALDAFWALPDAFLGDKVDAYGGALSYGVRYRLGRGPPEPTAHPDVVLRGHGRQLQARAGATRPDVLNRRHVPFTEDHWEDEEGAPVSRELLLLVLQGLEGIFIRAVYDGRMASVGLSDVAMDVTSPGDTGLGPAGDVEECRCPVGYAGLSCQRCAARFERVTRGPYLGTCSGCGCHGHSSTCDPVFGHCLNCQHNTEGPQCEKCKPGFFGDATKGTATACHPCPCPYTEPARRFSESCFLDTDGQATCDACAPGYAGRRCERCAPGYEGDPIQPGGKCTPIGQELVKCDARGGKDAAGGTCHCKPNVRGRLCDACAAGTFHLSAANPEGCLQCFCMGVSRHCASSAWSRHQVVLSSEESPPLPLANLAGTETAGGARFSSPRELLFDTFQDLTRDVYYWVLPAPFTGDKVTSYGGELRYTVTHRAPAGARPLPRRPDVLLQGNGILLEHFSDASPPSGVPTTVTVPFRERAWRRADGRDATREHLLMALADVDLFMIRASYADQAEESRLADVSLDVAVPHATGRPPALEVEDCACPPGYHGASCQDCDTGYTRSTAGLYLGTCEPCQCHGHAGECHPETGVCQGCRDHTEGAQCDKCQPGYYGDATRGTPGDCQPCPCHGPRGDTQATTSCFEDTDGQPTCSACAPGHSGRLCERCSPGYVGDPLRGEPCREPGGPVGQCRCDPRGTIGEGCDADGQCRCKANAEGPGCATCRPHHFHLSASEPAGCLPCFCMGIVQHCASTARARGTVRTPFGPGNPQGFALVNRQRSTRVGTGFAVEPGTPQPRLTYSRFGELPPDSYYWQLPPPYQGDKVGSYGGRLRYTLTYTPGGQGAPLPDADIQITGNDITLVAYQPDLPPRTPQAFEIVFREQYWQRPDGQPATREHLLMALADLDEILVRATYSTSTAASGIADVAMDTVVPPQPGLPLAPEVEECRCPPGYHGLSCQDCAPGYTRTGGGLYLGHCELCECNGHSESCHPESGVCSGCLHNTAGDFCDQCAPGFYGDATAGTPEDCQPCACPLPYPENQFSRTCESLGGGGYRCTACEPGYAGQYCERCAPGYTGDPTARGQTCVPVGSPLPLAVRVHPPRTTVAQGSAVTLRCQASGDPPFYYHWTREDGRPLPEGAQSRRQGEELHFASIQPSEAGVYVCSCRNLRHSNASRAEVIVTETPGKAITVTVEEKRVQRVKPGADVTFVCTAKSKSPAYTLVWTRQNHGTLPAGAVDFNGILTLRGVRPEDAGVYVCTGSNMLDMDEGTATLYVQAPSKTQMFYGPVEFMEGHRPAGTAAAPTAAVEPAQLSVAPGQPAEFRCVVTGSPPPTLEWLGALPPRAVIQGGTLRFGAVEPADEGHYACRARSSAGQHTARAFLHVQDAGAPRVQVSPERTEVQEGSTVRLYCRVSGSPTATITWEKQGGTLPPQSRAEHADIATLVIPAVTAADGGVYLCVGTSAAGTARAAIEVAVVPGMAPPVRIESSSPSVAEGQTLDLDCVVAGSGPATVTWYKRGGSLPAGHQVSGTRLRILQVTAADSGEYVCRVTSGSVTHETSLIVTIQTGAGSSYAVGVTPPVRIETSSAAVTEGQTLDLNCMVAGQGHPHVTWYRRGGALPPNSQVSGTRLRLVQVAAADSGEYVCRVTLGTVTQEASVIVTVPGGTGTYYPSGVSQPVRIESSSSAIAEGQTLDLNCVVAGSGPATVTWYKRGGSLPAGHQVSGTRLRIPRVTAADSGEYVCRVTSGGITQETSLIVTIDDGADPAHPTGVTPPIRIESSASSVTEGQTLDLDCLVAGQGQATITWYKRGGSLPAKHQVSGSRLRLSQLSVADSGEYVCRADMGSVFREATITVTVTSRDSSSYRLQSPIISIDPHSMAVAPGEDATFKCRIHDGARPINVTWRMGPGQHLQDNVKISTNGSVISITGAHVGNQGAYHCVASNRFGVASSVVNLLVQGAPTVSVMPPGPVTVKEGKSLSVECLGRGEPRPLVRWSRPGSRQKVEHQTLLHMDSQAILQLSPAKPEHAGTYVCTAHSALGSAQARVDVHVETAQRHPGAPEVTAPPSVTVVAGDTATLHCTARGEPAPRIEWSKLRAPLPWQHQVVNGSLVIPRAAQQDSGQYICNASSSAGSAEVFVTLDVETPPYATSLPEDTAVRAGDALQVQCLAHGTPPLLYAWDKVNGSLSARAIHRAGLLRISPALPADAGTYRCLVTNRVGTAETFARVAVHGDAGDGGDAGGGPLTVRVTPGSLVKGVGSTAEFACAVSGDPRARLEWLKDGGELPPTHSVRDGVLRMPELVWGAQGVYVCRASAPGGGQAEDRATLTVQALPRALINIRTAVQTVLAGTTVELECLGLGEPRPHVTWSKVGGRIRPGVLVRAGVLTIERVERADAGQYRCTAANAVGSVQSHVILHVQATPQIAGQPEVKEVSVGSAAVLPCLASGFPVPEITWSKLEGELPAGARAEGNVLTLPAVRHEDAGVYACAATNRRGQETAYYVLKVRERLVPYFGQTPRSFLPLPTIKDAYKRFEILITFRPDAADGLLLYNGQRKNSGADFISFGLVGGRPEFRFDAGSGMATIRHPTPLRLGEYHTVRLLRNLTRGSLALDGHPPVNGTSQGKFQGLDLNEELYLGGYPDFGAVEKTGLSRGFVGCVRQLRIQGEEVAFGDMDLQAHGVTSCPTCQDRPCQNGGVCQDAESGTYVCRCPHGFTGSNCEYSQALHCHPEACGADATCVNRPDGQGYTCRCHLGKAGERCTEGEAVSVPSFGEAGAFVSYPPLTNVHHELRVEAEFLPLAPDGLLLFSAGKAAPVEDFVALAMVGGHLEFRYELGSGPAVLRSAEPVTLGRWHRVTAERLHKDGTLAVDAAAPVKRSSPGKSQGLNLRTPLYLGGTEPPLRPPTNASFRGCIGEVSINGKKVDLSYSFLRSRGVGQCGQSSPCLHAACLHGGRCLPLPAGTPAYRCLCPHGFSGPRCEREEDRCLHHNPCLHGGTCKGSACLCPRGYTGPYCQHSLALAELDQDWQEGSGGGDAPGQFSAAFRDGSYLALPGHLFPRGPPEAPETIELELRTGSANGLLLWHGAEPGEGGKAKDFVGLGLKDGHLVFSYQLGSGEAAIVSEDPINDGEWHRVTVTREGRRGWLQVDGEEPVSGESPGTNVMANTQGSVYVGGAPDPRSLTAGKFSSGVAGCLRGLVLAPAGAPRHPIDLRHGAVGGSPAPPCPS